MEQHAPVEHGFAEIRIVDDRAAWVSNSLLKPSNLFGPFFTLPPFRLGIDERHRHGPLALGQVSGDRSTPGESTAMIVRCVE
jgi:hypothetical protein